MSIKNTFKKGFTLIELMIVIVILGILMGTILPRLTGAQSRARDTARIADLNNISQALEVYFSDSGKYPDATCTGDGTDKCGGGASDLANCLDDVAALGATPVATETYNLLKGYLKGDRVPQNVGVKTNSLGCVGSYFYSPLNKGGSPNASYALISDLETWQMANFDYSTDLPTTGPGAAGFVSSAEAKDYIVSLGKLDSEPTELDSIYVVIP